MLHIALPKGRLGTTAQRLFAKADCPLFEQSQQSRQLIFEHKASQTRTFLVKPFDVSIYVERGAADVGIVGKDVLLEKNPDVYELLDLQFGKCRMAVAAREDFVEDRERAIRVATKYPHIASSYYQSMNREFDIIKLNGSIELAPSVGLSDVIIDIVQTGKTLRENHLKVIADILPISARFIVNKAVYQFKYQEIHQMKQRLEQIIKKEDPQ